MEGRRCEERRRRGYGKCHVLIVFQLPTDRHRHSLRLDPSPFSSHGAEIMCSHRAQMAAAMWEQIRANKGWKLCIPDTSISTTIKKEGVETSWAMSSSACTDSEKNNPQSKLSACRGTEPCRPSAARRAYTSSCTRVQPSARPCEHNMCNGLAVRKNFKKRSPVDGSLGQDFSLGAFTTILCTHTLTLAHSKDTESIGLQTNTVWI